MSHLHKIKQLRKRASQNGELSRGRRYDNDNEDEGDGGQENKTEENKKTPRARIFSDKFTRWLQLFVCCHSTKHTLTVLQTTGMIALRARRDGSETLSASLGGSIHPPTTSQRSHPQCWGDCLACGIHPYIILMKISPSFTAQSQFLNYMNGKGHVRKSAQAERGATKKVIKSRHSHWQATDANQPGRDYIYIYIIYIRKPSLGALQSCCCR